MYYAWVGLIMSMNQAIIALFEMNKFKYRIEKIPEKKGIYIDTYTIFVQNLLRVLTQLNTNNQASTPKRVKFVKLEKPTQNYFKNG